MNVGDIMEAIAVQLKTISGLNAWGHPKGSVTAPAAIVTYPGEIQYDASYQRGMDKADPEVVVVVGNVYEKSTRTLINAYAAGSGPRSIKAVLEAEDAFDTFSIRVTGCHFEAVQIGAVEYLAARFTLDIAGQGA